ncbi:DMT family transporter [Nitrobacter winogradskyi]|uniref:Guanidinium exporter n=2 Tax=Nitrobacter winogradskyi TaxID=913 RepID=A0A4Y3WE93_NITWI|nr:multidrug efflux SMR transporter [Nitrobacter winogradskyi]MCP1997634.1 quaternary ammonium compound-resistance protein SugE [Nitrobacter winogradskyi]GEC17342.1 multidrug transporter [Nitrobacter winogradskyi]
MSWLYLFLAGLAETGWAIGLKYTDGFTRLWPSVFTGLGMALSFVLLSIAIRTLPVGTAYAIWTGIGATGTALLGMWLFAEPATTARFACLGLIIIGMVGLKVVSPA